MFLQQLSCDVFNVHYCRYCLSGSSDSMIR